MAIFSENGGEQESEGEMLRPGVAQDELALASELASRLALRPVHLALRRQDPRTSFEQ